jgi:hypothetical protein
MLADTSLLTILQNMHSSIAPSTNSYFIEPCIIKGTPYTLSPAALKNAESRLLWPLVLDIEERKACWRS